VNNLRERKGGKRGRITDDGPSKRKRFVAGKGGGGRGEHHRGLVFRKKARRKVQSLREKGKTSIISLSISFPRRGEGALTNLGERHDPSVPFISPCQWGGGCAPLKKEKREKGTSSCLDLKKREENCVEKTGSFSFSSLKKEEKRR